MKKNQIILGLVIMVGAVGSAFASKDLAAAAWVRVRFQGQTNFSCVSTGLMCDQSGASLCTVTIPDLSRTTKGYASGCATQLTVGSATPIGVYDPATQIVAAD